MKTRFAPSPTGYLHLGNMRTALFSALLAQQQQGCFLLRVEDTDQTRSTKDYAEQLQVDLSWLGIHWQEGPGVEGAQTPYFQSQRQEIYTDYFQRLREKNLVYPCFCSDQELLIARKVQLAAGQPPRYAGTCRQLTAEQVAQRQQAGQMPTLRFRVPDSQIIEFNDLVRGPQRFNSNEVGDFIIRRADGTAAFFFCNALDDALMGVTHVLRGEDHLTNTPRQLLLLQALGLQAPEYGHIALIVGLDGSPLSKREGSTSVRGLREHGYLASAVCNYLARVGHYYANNAFMNWEQLAAEFTITHLGSAPAHFDPAQLLYWQKQAVQQLTEQDFWQWLGTEVQTQVPVSLQSAFFTAIQANVVFPADAKHWAKILLQPDWNMPVEASALIQQAGSAFYQHAARSIEQHGADYQALVTTLQQTLGVKGKALFAPLRLALTGQQDGPELAKIMQLLGVEQLQLRLAAADAQCK